MNCSTLYDADKALLYVFSGCHNPFVDKLALTLTCGYMWIPLYIAIFVLIVQNNKTIPQISLVIGMVLLGMLLSEGMADLIVKPFVCRTRPTYDTLLQHNLHIVDNYRAEGYSFFSAHASNTMTVAVFFSMLVRNRLLTWTLIIWALVNCWTRLYLGVHYPSDIVVGMFWGAVSGLLSYAIYNKVYSAKRKGASVDTATTRMVYRRKDINTVLYTLLVLVIFAIIYSLT